MWRDRPASESTRIGRYWDAVVTGGDTQPTEIAATAIRPTLVETISRLERLDDARPASTDFSRQFETSFLEAIGETAQPAAPKPANGVAKFDVAQLAEARRGLLEFPVARADRRRLLAAIAAALLLFAAIGGAYYVVERQDGAQVASDPNVIPAPSTNFGVPMDRGNPARSGVMPGPGISPNLALRWNFEAGQGGISAPALVGDTIYITSGSELDLGSPGSVIAIDAATGGERWRFPAEHAAIGTPSVTGGIVYASDMGGIVYAIDAGTGEQIWRHETDSGWASAPVVVGDSLYIAGAPYRVSLYVAVQDATVVVGSGLVGQASDGVKLFALDRWTGEERWQSTDGLTGRPGLFAFHANDGALQWAFEMPSLESGPAVSGQRVYAGSTLDGTIYAVDLTSGDEMWRAAIGEDLPQNSSPAVARDSVFVTTAFDGIICIDASSGTERWRASVEHVSLNSSAIVVDDKLYVVDTRWGVSAFSTADGSELWSEDVDLTGQVVDSPIVSNGNLFIVTSLEGEKGHVAKLWVFAGTGGIDQDAGESS